MNLADQLRPHLLTVLDTARGRAARPDPALGSSGGPAGNARLTAWLGLTLLVLFVAELVTVLDVRGLISWHVAIGALLIPPSLAKTATTGWRIARYYRRAPGYVAAGPPPLLLRSLGPLVVLGTLAVLGTGVLVELLGQDAGRQPYVRVVGFGISALTLHQASVIVWAVATGLHVLARLLPAVRLVRSPDHAVLGGRARGLVLAATAVAAGLLAPVLLSASSTWRSDNEGGGLRHHHAAEDARRPPSRR